LGCDDTVTTCLLGAVKGSIGNLQDSFYCAAMFRIDGDAYRQSDSVMSFSQSRNLQKPGCLTQLFGALAGHLQGGIGQDQYEFFTPIPAGHIFSPDMALEKLCQALKEAVAGGMTVSIVEPLEVVDIDHEDAEWTQLAGDTPDFAFERFLHVTPVE
jgi:hypothetical protein